MDEIPKKLAVPKKLVGGGTYGVLQHHYRSVTPTSQYDSPVLRRRQFHQRDVLDRGAKKNHDACEKLGWVIPIF
jgi:hypothetical protein